MDTQRIEETWWDSAYRSGEFRRHWDMLLPSQELVCFVATGLIPDGSSTLDVGCGAGTEAIFLAQCGYRSIGVDLSGEALRIASTRADAAGLSVDFRVGSALALPVRDTSVEFVNDRGCFHHIPEEQRDRFAQEMSRVLKPGGHMLLRGCREHDDEVPFVLATPGAIQKYFNASFEVSPILPVDIYSDSGKLPCNLAIMRRK